MDNFLIVTAAIIVILLLLVAVNLLQLRGENKSTRKRKERRTHR